MALCMSIEHCKLCSFKVDTDFDTESLIDGICEPCINNYDEQKLGDLTYDQREVWIEHNGPKQEIFKQIWSQQYDNGRN